MTPDDTLPLLLATACEDALFAVAGTGTSALEGIARRRAAAYEALAKRGPAPKRLADGQGWLEVMARASAPVGAPWFVPMHDAIDGGLSLEAEPRGLRAVIPIGQAAHVERVRREGAFAVRVLRAVVAADGPPADDEKKAVDLLLSALALPDDDDRVLRAEPPVPIATLAIPEGIDNDRVQAVVEGAWEAAAVDGVDEAERAAIEQIAVRMGVSQTTLDKARAEGERKAKAQYALGLAVIDAVRYVCAILDDDSALVEAAVLLSIPAPQRIEVRRAVTTHDRTPLAASHDLDRHGRATVLATAWAAALAGNPTLTLRARLRERHDRLAKDLRAERAGAEARATIDEHLERVLSHGVVAAGG